jgi:hypothetical protein
MTGVLTVSIWHNVTRDAEGRHAGFGGFTPGDQMVKVFTYDLPPGGSRDLTAIAENAFAIGNGAPGLDGRAAELAARTPGDGCGQSRSLETRRVAACGVVFVHGSVARSGVVYRSWMAAWSNLRGWRSCGSRRRIRHGSGGVPGQMTRRGPLVRWPLHPPAEKISRTSRAA